jgi:hypothetical protein
MNLKNVLIAIANSDELAGETIQQKILEGSMRNNGIHACGVIITPSDISILSRLPRPKIRIDIKHSLTTRMRRVSLLKMDFGFEDRLPSFDKRHSKTGKIVEIILILNPDESLMT